MRGRGMGSGMRDAEDEGCGVRTAVAESRKPTAESRLRASEEQVRAHAGAKGGPEGAQHRAAGVRDARLARHARAPAAGGGEAEAGDHARAAGVGLSSIRSRAEELGGRCVVAPTGRGTRVRAVLPVRA